MRGRIIPWEGPHRCNPLNWWERFKAGVKVFDEWVCPECGRLWRWDWLDASSSMTKRWVDTYHYAEASSPTDAEA